MIISNTFTMILKLCIFLGLTICSTPTKHLMAVDSVTSLWSKLLAPDDTAFVLPWTLKEINIRYIYKAESGNLCEI